MEATNDIFRFMAVRPVQRISELTIGDKRINLQRLPNGTNLNMSSMGAVSVQTENIPTLDSVDDLSPEVKIPQIEQYLLSEGDRPKLEDLVQRIKRLTTFSPNDLIETPEYNYDRSRVVATLLLLLVDPSGKEDFRGLMLRYMRVFGLIEYIVLRADVDLTPDDIFNFLLNSFVLLPKIFNAPANALARTPGIADLKVVRQKLLRYEPGEIAYIENVLKGELRERIHRREDVREETFLQETEKSTDTSSDLQSTERFELNKETSRVITEDSQLEAGATISATYGPVSASANLGYATSNSKQESENNSSSYARDVTQRSSSRIQERVREVRSTRTVKKVEESNKHGIDNSKGGENVVGIYRWVDKIYEAQVFNYGKRLLLEFVVPEPAAFYKYAFMSKTSAGITVEKPKEPLNDAGQKLTPSDITRENYLSFVSKYYVAGVNPPPRERIVLSVGWVDESKPDSGIKPSTPGRKIYKLSKDLKLTPGYTAESAAGRIYVSDFLSNVFMTIGGTAVTFQLEGQGGAIDAFSQVGGFNTLLTGEPGKTGEVAISLLIENAWGYSIAFDVYCKILPDTFVKWQIDTYQTIMQAYFELKSQYDEQIAASRIQQGVQIQGQNPLQNRSIERTEIKKSIVSMLTQQNFDKPPLEDEAIAEVPPRINFGVAEQERDFIQWFEQAFEWTQMTYVYYPYFWGDKKNWAQALNDEDVDSLFAAFLEAGAARAIVPVRPGFESAMSLYLATGIIWRGSQLPQVNDPLYVSIVQELQEQQQADSTGVAEGNPWEVRLPTTLTILQKSSELMS